MKNTRNKFTIFFVFLITSLFLYYVLFMRRSFVRSNSRLPFMLSSSLNQSLLRYVNTLPSRNTMFVTGAYESGKSQMLNMLAEKLAKNEQRLVLNLDAKKFSNEAEFVQSMLTELTTGFVNLRQNMPYNLLKEINTKFPSLNKSVKLPFGIDQMLGTCYLKLENGIKEILDKNGKISTSGVHDFLNTMQLFYQTLNPVIFIHGGDKLIGCDLWEIVKAALSRKNLYNDFIPIVIELDDSSVLNDYELLSSINNIRVVSSEDFNETACEILIRSRIFSSPELRKINNKFGLHGGSLSHIFENLKFGMSIDDAIQKEKKYIEDNLNKNLQLNKKTHYIAKFCKSNGIAFADNIMDINNLKPLFEKGYVYTDSGFQTRVANKVVLKAICS